MVRKQKSRCNSFNAFSSFQIKNNETYMCLDWDPLAIEILDPWTELQIFEWTKLGDKEIWRASASLKGGLESHPLEAWFFLTSSIQGCPKKMGTLLRGCLRCCASGGNHLTFKLCLCSFGQTSRPMMGSALNLASHEDQFFHLQHLIKNNCAITLLKNPFQRGTLSFFQGLKFGIAMVQ